MQSLENKLIMRVVFGIAAGLLAMTVTGALMGLIYSTYIEYPLADYLVKGLDSDKSFLQAVIYEPMFYAGLLFVSFANISIPAYIAGMVSERPVLLSALVGATGVLITLFATSVDSHNFNEKIIIICIMTFQFIMGSGTGIIMERISNKQ